MLCKPDDLETGLKAQGSTANREIVAMWNERIELRDEKTLQSVCFFGDVRFCYDLQGEGIRPEKSKRPVEFRAFSMSLKMRGETTRYVLSLTNVEFAVGRRAEDIDRKRACLIWDFYSA